MFVQASEFRSAKLEFQDLFLELFDKHGGELMLGELIFIEKLEEGGDGDPVASSLEFTDTWLRSLGIDFEVVGQTK